jgi:hypothetical protein
MDQKEITLYRASGHSVDNRDGYLKELNKEMDKLEETLGKPNIDNAQSFSAKMANVDHKLQEKYPRKKIIEFPNGAAEIHQLCKKYGSVAFCIEDNKMVMYILDA